MQHKEEKCFDIKEIKNGCLFDTCIYIKVINIEMHVYIPRTFFFLTHENEYQLPGNKDVRMQFDKG